MQRRLGHRSSWQRRLIGLALSALLAAQWLALAHSVGHRWAGSAPADGWQASGASLGQGLLKAVTGHDEKSPVCQLFDQLAHSTPFCASAPAIGADASPQAQPPGTLRSVPAGAPFFYGARAPPVLA